MTTIRKVAAGNGAATKQLVLGKFAELEKKINAKVADSEKLQRLRKEIEKTKIVVETIFDEKTPHTLKANHISGIYVFDVSFFASDYRAECKEIVELTIAFLRNEGYRHSYIICTPQERFMGDGTPLPEIVRRPFRPIAMSKELEKESFEWLTQEEIDRARRLAGYGFYLTATRSYGYTLAPLFTGNLSELGRHLVEMGREEEIGTLQGLSFKEEKTAILIGCLPYVLKIESRSNGVVSLHDGGGGLRLTNEPLDREGNTVRNPRPINPLYTVDKLADIFENNKYEKALELCTVETISAKPPYWKLRN